MHIVALHVSNYIFYYEQVILSLHEKVTKLRFNHLTAIQIVACNNFKLKKTIINVELLVMFKCCLQLTFILTRTEQLLVKYEF